MSLWFAGALICVLLFYYCMDQHASLKNRDLKSQLLQSNEQIKSGVDKYTEAVENCDKQTSLFIDKQMQIYRESLEKNQKGEIITPPNFSELQKRALLSSADDVEKWARNLSALRGMEKEIKKLEYTALDLRAKELELKFMPLIQPIILNLQKVISGLNKENTFGGEIRFNLAGVDRIVIPQGYNNFRGNLAQIIFPNNTVWPIELKPVIITPNYSPKGSLECPTIVIKDLIITLGPNGLYTFSKRSGLRGWGRNRKTIISEEEKEFVGKTGGEDLLLKAMQNLFYRNRG